MSAESPKFYIIATPIGNMADITYRAIETLKGLDLLLCEDTRTTKKLLDKYQIEIPTISYHSHSTDAKENKVIEMIKGGKILGLVSDAGTPGISDPGSMLIAKVREKLPEVEIVPIPGASALISALSASGLHINQFTFLGFLPHKKGRETLFKEIAEAKRTYVFYESTHRILKTLESLREHCSEKKVCIARELTKIYEEFKIGIPAELLEYFTENQEKQKGEFVVIVSN